MITSAIHRKVKTNHSIKCGDYDRDSSHIIQITLFPGSAKEPDLCVINHPFHTMGCRHRGGYLPPVCLINRLKMCLTERCYKALKRGAKGVCKMAERGSYILSSITGHSRMRANVYRYNIYTYIILIVSYCFLSSLYNLHYYGTIGGTKI